LTPEGEVAFRNFAAWKHRQKDRGMGGDLLPSPRDVYAELMKAAFGPALRGAGLRGSNGRFELPSDMYWAQLSFQKSAYSGGDEVRFTVNLSVVSRAEWALRSAAAPYLGRQPSPSFQYGSWADQARIGKLTPAGGDKWWRIVRGVDSGPVLDDALADLMTYGVPWLRRHTLS
jgi:Domain of unknown function (DUF4304)